jgi:ubiquinone/menaquinone biosynthesis C-methylase UbiE
MEDSEKEKEKEYYSQQKNWDFSKIKYTTVYNPENEFDFYTMIKKYSSQSSLCLDLGTGGGENLLRYYADVGYIIAIDNSKEMIETANQNLKSYNNKKVKFVMGDNLDLKFPDNLFDLVSARNTNSDPKKVFNVLKKGGAFIIQGVDTKDCWEIKEYFKRGQNYGSKQNFSDIEYQGFDGVGFSYVKLFPILFTEYYESKEELLKLLLKAPIINDFDNNANAKIEDDILEKYVKDHQKEKGIELKRVYYGILAIK